MYHTFTNNTRHIYTWIDEQSIRQLFQGFLVRIFGIRPERGRDGRTDGTDGRTDGTDGRTDGTDGRTDGIQFYSTTGTEKYSVTVLLTVYCLISKLYFRYYINYLVVST